VPRVDGRELRRRRVALGLKLGEFAELSRVKYKTLANIESKGSQPVSIERVTLIAGLLGAEVDDLLIKKDAAA
jgi:transcriptional regulator with XRE-family HTH domain